jgi:hypothetical protein
MDSVDPPAPIAAPILAKTVISPKTDQKKAHQERSGLPGRKNKEGFSPHSPEEKKTEGKPHIDLLV